MPWSKQTRKAKSKFTRRDGRGQNKTAQAMISSVCGLRNLEGKSRSLLTIIVWNQEDRFGTVSTNPMVTEIVDEGLFSGLKKAEISDGDAMHLMYAVHNKCDRF